MRRRHLPKAFTNEPTHQIARDGALGQPLGNDDTQTSRPRSSLLRAMQSEMRRTQQGSVPERLTKRRTVKQTTITAKALAARNCRDITTFSVCLARYGYNCPGA